MDNKVEEKMPSRIYSKNDKHNLVSIWENIISGICV